MNFTESLFKYLPAYFSDFIGLLGSPKKFLLNKSSGEGYKEDMRHSMVFLLVSFLITLLIFVFVTDDIAILSGFISNDVNFLTKFVAKSVVYLLYIVLVVAIIRLAYRAVGGKANLERSYIGLNYILGMLMVFNASIEIVTESIANTDPMVAKYKVIMQKEQKHTERTAYEMAEMVSAPGAMQDTAKLSNMMKMMGNQAKVGTMLIDSKMLWLSVVVGIGGYIIAGIWLLVSLGFFRRVNEVSFSRNIVALVLAGVGILVVTSLMGLANSGKDMMSYMKERYSNDSTATLASLAAEADARMGGNSMPAANMNMTAPAVQEQPATSEQQQAIPDAVTYEEPAGNSTSTTPVNNTTVATTASTPKKGQRYYGTIGGRKYIYIATSEQGNQSTGYMYAADMEQEKYYYELVADASLGVTITIYDGNNNYIAAGAFEGQNANGCIYGYLFQQGMQQQYMEICE